MPLGLQQLMNLNWLFFYLIKVFDVVVLLNWSHKALEICLVLIIIITVLFYYDLSHSEFNSSYFEDFSTAHLKLVVRGAHVIADDHP